MNGWTPSTQNCAAATHGWTERPSNMGRIAIEFTHGSHRHPFHPTLSPLSPRIIALLGTSRRLRFECLPILYRLNQVHVPSHPPNGSYSFMSRDGLGTIAWTSIREFSCRLWDELSYIEFQDACAVFSKLPNIRRVEILMTPWFLCQIVKQGLDESSHDDGRPRLCIDETLSSNIRNTFITKQYREVFQYFDIGIPLKVEVVWYSPVDQVEPADVFDNSHNCTSVACAILETMKRCKETHNLQNLPILSNDPDRPCLESFVLRCRVQRAQPEILEEEEESLGVSNDMFKVLLPRFRRSKSLKGFRKRVGTSLYSMW